MYLHTIIGIIDISVKMHGKLSKDTGSCSRETLVLALSNISGLAEMPSFISHHKMAKYRDIFIRQLSAFTSSQLAHRSNVGHSSDRTHSSGIQARCDKTAVMRYNNGPVLYAFCSRQHCLCVLARAFAQVSKSSYLPHPFSWYADTVPQRHKGMQQQDILYVARPTCTYLHNPPHVSKHCLLTVIIALQNDLAGSGRFLTAAEQTVQYTLDNNSSWKSYDNDTTLPRLSSFKVTHTERYKSYALTTQAMYCTNKLTLRRDR